MPVNLTVTFDLESADMMHGLWPPRLDGKRDVIPNHVHNVWWTPTEIAITPGPCVQFRSTSHANRCLFAVVRSQANFTTRVADQKAAPANPSSGAAAQGKALLQTSDLGPGIGPHCPTATPLLARSAPQAWPTAANECRGKR